MFNLTGLLKGFRAKPRQASAPLFFGPRFPASDKANDWMSDKLRHWKTYNPDIAYLLLDPSSGDYMPLAVHVGSSWKAEHQSYYRQLKADNPDLVAKGRKSYSDGGRFYRSRVGDPEDFIDIGPMLP